MGDLHAGIIHDSDGFSLGQEIFELGYGGGFGGGISFGWHRFLLKTYLGALGLRDNGGIISLARGSSNSKTGFLKRVRRSLKRATQRLSSFSKIVNHPS